MWTGAARRQGFPAGLCLAALTVTAMVSPAQGITSSPVIAVRAALPCGEEEGWGDVTGWPDLDEDCEAELVVGAPGWNVGTATDAGAVLYVDGTERDSDSRLITARSLGFSAQSAAGFGSSMFVTDLDGESPMDLVIGAPGESVNGVASAGAVYVVYGSSSGLGAGRAAARLTAASLGLSNTGGRFGSALTAWPTAPSGQSQLAVGEPLAKVDGKSGAGRLVSIDVPSLRVGRVISQGHGAPGASETGDRFAASLATVWDDVLEELYLLAGSPYEDVGSIVDAGAVTVFEPTRSFVLTQDSARVPGAAERGDHFGAALTGIDGQPFGNETSAGALMAAPEEDIGSVKDAGALVMLNHVVNEELQSSWRPYVHAITADSPGFPGSVESGDRLGSTLADEFVGLPFEDIGSDKDAGSVCMIDFGRITAAGRVPSQCFDQDSAGVPGAGEAGDRFGQALTTVFEGGSDDPPYYLVVGVPGEDIGTTQDAGAVLVGDLNADDGVADWEEPLGSLQMPSTQVGGLRGGTLPKN
jgi:hypothetical protein